MARQLIAALVILLTVGGNTSAQRPQLIERALGDLEWGMSQARVRERLGASAVVQGVSSGSLPLAPTQQERVLVGRDQFSRSFYYFRSGKLRKVYSLLEPCVFPEGNFAAFVAALQRRLGPAKQARGELAPGIRRRWMEWRQGRTRMRAIDETQHLGCYALVYEEAH